MTYLTALALYAAVALPLAVSIGRVIRGGDREQSNGAAHHASAFPSTRIRGK